VKAVRLSRDRYKTHAREYTRTFPARNGVEKNDYEKTTVTRSVSASLSLSSSYGSIQSTGRHDVRRNRRDQSIITVSECRFWGRSETDRSLDGVFFSFGAKQSKIGSNKMIWISLYNFISPKYTVAQNETN